MHHKSILTSCATHYHLFATAINDKSRLIVCTFTLKNLSGSELNHWEWPEASCDYLPFNVDVVKNTPKWSRTIQSFLRHWSIHFEHSWHNYQSMHNFRLTPMFETSGRFMEGLNQTIRSILDRQETTVFWNLVGANDLSSTNTSQGHNICQPVRIETPETIPADKRRFWRSTWNASLFVLSHEKLNRSHGSTLRPHVTPLDVLCQHYTRR